MRKHVLALAAATMLVGPAAALAQEAIMPALVYGTGGKFDRSFNEAAYSGAEMFSMETGIAYRDFEPQNDTQGEQALRDFAERGFNPIIAISFTWEQAMQTVAAEFPDTDFVIIDAVVDLPNVHSITFKEQEGSYLVGVLAAMASQTGTVGFVGGMDVPLIRRFECGYAEGARSVSPDITVLQNMTGTTGAAFNDPVRGAELANAQFDQGADVVFHAAGGTGIGVLQAAADRGLLGIGVDSNQNYLHPGNVLTSMVKRVDVAVYNALMESHHGAFMPGLTVLGLAEGGVGWALDEYNMPLITPEMTEAVNAAEQAIISGDVVVHDYLADNACPV